MYLSNSFLLIICLFPTFRRNAQFFCLKRSLMVDSPIPEYAAASFTVRFCFSQIGTSFLFLLSMVIPLFFSTFYPPKTILFYSRHQPSPPAGSHMPGTAIPTRHALFYPRRCQLPNSENVHSFSGASSCSFRPAANPVNQILCSKPYGQVFLRTTRDFITLISLKANRKLTFICGSYEVFKEHHSGRYADELNLMLT